MSSGRVVRSVAGRRLADRRANCETITASFMMTYTTADLDLQAHRLKPCNRAHSVRLMQSATVNSSAS